jgi:hypothetical protein
LILQTHALIKNTIIIKLLGRHREGNEYAFPTTVVIVAGAALTYYFFKVLPQVENMLRAIYP